MAEKKKIYNWYLILSIIQSSITILAVPLVLLIPDSSRFLLVFWSPINSLWFAFNIAFVVIIYIRDIERIALLLPALHIWNPIFIMLVDYIAHIVAVARGFDLEMIPGNPLIILLTLFFPLITLACAVALLRRSALEQEGDKLEDLLIPDSD